MYVRRFVLAVSLTLAVCAMSVGPVSAYSNVHQNGSVGTWYFNDSSSTPGATCGYGPEYAPDYAGFRWMKVKPPTVFAADRDSNKREHRTIKWYFKLQQAHYPELNWKTVKTSAVQSKIAYEDQAAPLTALQINKNVGNPDYTDTEFRAKVYIKWVKADGTVEGSINATIDFYKMKAFGYEVVSSNPYCAKVTTQG